MNQNKIIKKISLFIIVCSLLFTHLLLFITSKKNGQISGLSQTFTTDVNVDISIGEHRFSLFGYSSPHALITLQGVGIFDQTYANDKGFFQFSNRFSPLSPREACLSAKDQFGRLSPSLCLPPFPTNYNVTVGPVIMPPTLSLDKNNYWAGDEIKLSGQTIPESKVNFSLFTKDSHQLAQNTDLGRISGVAYNYRDNRKPTRLTPGPEDLFKHLILSFFGLIQPVDAFSFPQMETVSDDKGNFSLAFHSFKAQTFRLFAQINYQKNRSPQSLKLTVKILPWWMIIVQIFLTLFSLIKSRLLEIIIAAEIVGLVIFFFRRYLHPHVIAANRALAVRKQFPIIVRRK